MRNGRIEIKGIAASMTQALQFREKLTEIGKSHEIEWTFPVPETMADGMRVKFRAVGELSKDPKKSAIRSLIADPRDDTKVEHHQ